MTLSEHVKDFEHTYPLSLCLIKGVEANVKPEM